MLKPYQHTKQNQKDLRQQREYHVHTFSRANFFVYQCLIFFYLIVWRWAYLPTYNVLTTRYENTSSPPSAIMPVRFGDFQPLCTNTPSYPWCNLFYRQVCIQSIDLCQIVWKQIIYSYYVPLSIHSQDSQYPLHLHPLESTRPVASHA